MGLGVDLSEVVLGLCRGLVSVVAADQYQAGLDGHVAGERQESGDGFRKDCGAGCGIY